MSIEIQEGTSPAAEIINVEVTEQQQGQGDVVVIHSPSDADHSHFNEPEPTDASSSPHNDILSSSDLSIPERKIWVVTTAALPWRTGTALNPLMRALYLTRGRPPHAVTLLVPWLNDERARKKLYGEQNAFAGGKREQETWIRNYCSERAGAGEEEQKLRILFWEGKYHDSFGSIFPVVDICSLIPKDQADVAILEEPEHLNWWRVPPSDTDEQLGWAHKFKHVVGIVS